MNYDVIVIGSGPGGYVTAIRASQLGLKTAIVEKENLGGVCLNWGCIPTKALIKSAQVFEYINHANDYGINVNGASADFSAVIKRSRDVADGMSKGIQFLMKKNKIDVIDGAGVIKKGGMVEVTAADGKKTTYTAKHTILATGSRSRELPNLKQDGKKVIGYRQAMTLAKQPKSMVIVGSGAIGCEFASTFADLGSTVTILEGLPKILPGLDADLANVVVKSFKKKNIDIKTGVAVKGHTLNGSGGTVVSFGEGETLEVDAVVVSVGRRPSAELLGLQGTAVKLSERGFIEVDQYCTTAEPGVYAVGDIINTPQLAHVAYAEAILAVKRILGEPVAPVNYDRVPWAIYCHPEVAWAGYSEESAIAAGFDVVVGKHQFRANSRAMIIGDTDGLVKVIAKKNADGTAGQILGVQMVGAWVTEQLSGGYLAVNWEATVAEVAEFIQPHPSLSELFGETMLSMTGRSINA
jgi:dihydrolipoamide dehydrogenase